ncbi:MAG: hypothetical protein HZC28_00385 [Spirochaetes bacterium]|nr:hypothetical protein [Spirochaetota bacterium]
MARVFGQSVSLKILYGVCREERLHHAYLFHGDEGVGKYESALNFTKALFCEKKDGTYCDACPSCTAINDYRHPDVLVVATDDRNNVARFLYERLLAFPSPQGFRSFVSAVRSILNRVENRLLPAYDTYPASLPKEHMVGVKSDKNRAVSLEAHYLAVAGTITRLTLTGAKDLKRIFEEEALAAIETARGHLGGRKAIELKDFFDTLDKLYSNITHTTIPIDTIREVISRVERKPAGGRRVVIIENFDRMESMCANIFLHTLEEPPPDNLFILITSHLDAVPKGVINPLSSRTMQLHFGALNKDALVNVYEKAFHYPEAQARALALETPGSIGRGIRRTSGTGAAAAQGNTGPAGELIDAIISGDPVHMAAFISGAKDGVTEQFLEDMIRACTEAAAAAKAGGPAPHSELARKIQPLFVDISMESIILCVEQLDGYLKRVRSMNVNGRLIVVAAAVMLHQWLARSASGRRQNSQE